MGSAKILSSGTTSKFLEVVVSWKYWHLGQLLMLKTSVGLDG